MDNNNDTDKTVPQPPAATAERPLSRTREEIMKEAKRIEEDALYSSKGHFAAAHLWGNFHLWVGVPMVVLAGTSGAAALARFDKSSVIAGVLSLVVVGLSAVMTFLNPNAKAGGHLNAGNNYEAMRDRARVFWAIECWRGDSDEVLTDKLKQLCDQKDKLNHGSPQIPRWAYRKAKRGVAEGEATHSVDKPGNATQPPVQ